MSDPQKNEMIRELVFFSETDTEQIASSLAQASYAYAVIEQSLYPDFMARLYAVECPSLTWDFLFTNERDDALRQAGPVLITLNSDALISWLIPLLTQQAGGCLLQSSSDFNETLSWAQERMTLLSPNGAQAICRFYDPKNLAFMLASQTTSQQQRFWHQTQQWHWFDAGQWWQYQSEPSPNELISPYQLSHEELEGIAALKLELNKRKLIQHYQGASTKDESTVAQLAEQAFDLGQIYGATAVKDYDAWLRLSILYGQDFYRSAFAKAQLENPNYPLHKNLALIKRQLESVA